MSTLVPWRRGKPDMPGLGETAPTKKPVFHLSSQHLHVFEVYVSAGSLLRGDPANYKIFHVMVLKGFEYFL